MKTRFINKIIFYTVLVFCISAFSYFPKSYSKYIKDEEPAKFYVGIDKLYIGDVQTLNLRSTSTYKVANYEFQFDRSQVMKDYDTSQQILVKVEQEKCQITKIYSNGNNSINGNEATITYTTSGTDRVIVEYSCNVSDITVTENELDLIYTNVKVYEKFMPEDVEYLYAKADGIKTLLSSYYEKYPIPKATISDDGKTLTIPEVIDDKYTEFTTWINVINSNYSNIIKTYIETTYNSQEDILNTTKSLKGLTYTYDSTNNNHVYQIDDNFVGYARTYYYVVKPDDFVKIYYSNPNLTDDEANGILRYYLETYAINYGYTTEDINNIIQYVSKHGRHNGSLNGSLNYIMKPNDDSTYNKIAGFTYLPEGGDIVFSSSLMSFVKASSEQKITIAFGGKVAMFNTYSDSLAVAFDFLSEEMITILTTDTSVFPQIYKSIIKNNETVTEKTVYSDYFTVKDSNNNYVLVNVYSDKVNTYVEVIELGVANTITVTNVDNQLNVSITLDNQDKVLSKSNVINTVAGLDSYLGTNYKDEIVDGLFTESKTIGNITSVIEENNITISYTITVSE